MRAILLLIFICTARVFAVPVDLKGPADATDTVSDVYRDIVVVQRRAKKKAGHVVFQFFESADFSDGPQAIYTSNFSLGYAFSESFEAALNVAPLFFTQDRPIKGTVADLNLANGQHASLDSPAPKLQFGIDLFWLPIYGKDSWGPTSIVRSDTFFKLSIADVQFTAGSGMRYSLGLGKTFFFSRYFNPRITASFGYHETIVNDVKNFSAFGLLEIGSTWYF